MIDSIRMELKQMFPTLQIDVALHKGVRHNHVLVCANPGNKMSGKGILVTLGTNKYPTAMSVLDYVVPKIKEHYKVTT